MTPAQIDFFLHPQLTADARAGPAEDGRLVLATGLNVSPGAAVGTAVFDPDTAQRLAADGRAVILLRPETKPDDVHGMLAAQGIVTTRGGRTSHAALVARQFGKPAVVGAASLEIDPVGSPGHDRRPGRSRRATGCPSTAAPARSTCGRLETFVPDLNDAWLAPAAVLGRRVPPTRRPGQRRQPARRAAGAQQRRRGHRPVPHRAHVLRPRPAAR